MKIFHFLAVIAIAALAVVGCDSDSSTSPDEGSGTGTLKLLLTDAPAEYDAVNVTFSEVSVHFGEESVDEESEGAEKTAGEWIVLSSEIQTFNLLDLSNGATALLGEAVLDAGHYTQLRLVIDEAEVVIGEEAFALTIPSGTLKFVSGFDVVEDMETEMVVDFDAARSVHMTGNDEYKLKPTIRVINGGLSGKITGTVTNPENDPIAYAMVGDDIITSSNVDTVSGEFTLGFLDPGTYKVLVEDTLDASYENLAVTVTVGTNTKLGDITLE